MGSLLFESIWKLFMSKFGLNGMSEKELGQQELVLKMKGAYKEMV
jgi:hypothetical protein